MSESESTQPPKSNIPEFSVGELAGALKKTLEENYAHVRVRGELSRITVAKSGHMYTDLKDDQAVINSICWKGTLSKLSIKPEEGMEVICTGRVSTYPARSNYQLIIDSMELAGEGALLKMLEERRKKLAAEGLFADERKKRLPFLPQTIGVVTSPTGAVIRDILHRISERFPRHVILWPVMVQGDGAAGQIANAITGFNALPDGGGVPKPDLLIVGRGGGSLEDLMAFNEENVTRAIVQSTIPVISAVGHETDTTLADYAADLRAPTPTGAAEKAVPVRTELLGYLLECEQRLIAGTTRALTEKTSRLETLAAKLGDPARLMENQMQRIDHLGIQLKNAYTRTTDKKKQTLIEIAAHLKHPKDRLTEQSHILKRWAEQLCTLGPKITHDPQTRLSHAGKMLEAYSFENVLKRGFTVIRDENGKTLTSAENIQDGQSLNIQFKDQKYIPAVAGAGQTPHTTRKLPTTPRKKTAKSKDDNQQSLF